MDGRPISYILYFTYVLLARLVLLLGRPFLDLPEAFHQSQQFLVPLQVGHQSLLILEHQYQVLSQAFGSVYLLVNVLPFLEIDLFIEDSRALIDQLHIVINLLLKSACEAVDQYENQEGLRLRSFIYDGNYFRIYIVPALQLLFDGGKMLLIFWFGSKVEYFKGYQQPIFLVFGVSLQAYCSEGLKVMFDFFFPFQPRVVYTSRRLFHNLLVLFVAVCAGRSLRGRVVGVWGWRWGVGQCVGRVSVLVRHINYAVIQLVSRFELAS